MKTIKQIALIAAALLLSACVVAPESFSEDLESAEAKEPEAVCACHVPEINGRLRCVAACPSGLVCATTYQICVAPVTP